MQAWPTSLDWEQKNHWPITGPHWAEQSVPTLNSLLTYLSLLATSCHSDRAAGALVRSKEVSLLKDLHPRIQSGSANRADSELANQGFSQTQPPRWRAAWMVFNAPLRWHRNNSDLTPPPFHSLSNTPPSPSFILKQMLREQGPKVWGLFWKTHTEMEKAGPYMHSCAY